MLKHWSEQNLSCLRLAVGVTLSLMLALTLAWPGSFLMAIITAILLSTGEPPIPLKSGLFLILATAGLLTFGQALTELTLHMPVVCSVLIILFVIIGQYAMLGGMSMLLVVVLYIAVLVLPLLGMASPVLVEGIVGGLFSSISLAVLCSWLIFAVFPYRGEGGEAKPKPEALPESERLKKAILLTMLVLPVFFLFYLLEMTGDVLILIFVVLLIQMPSTEMGVKSGVGLLLANALGGLAAVVIYKTLTLAPSLIMLALLIFIFSLLFAGRIFSDHPLAKLYGSGLNTIIVILGSTTGAYGDGAAETIYIRLLQIAMAVIYVIAMLSLLEAYRDKKVKLKSVEV